MRGMMAVLRHIARRWLSLVLLCALVGAAPVTACGVPGAMSRQAEVGAVMPHHAMHHRSDCCAKDTRACAMLCCAISSVESAASVPFDFPSLFAHVGAVALYSPVIGVDPPPPRA